MTTLIILNCKNSVTLCFKTLVVEEDIDLGEKLDCKGIEVNWILYPLQIMLSTKLLSVTCCQAWEKYWVRAAFGGLLLLSGGLGLLTLALSSCALAAPVATSLVLKFSSIPS